MKKKELLFSMLLLFVGVSMRAQSVATEQMDERFNDAKLPYGWFAEGWEVKDGVAKKKASEGFDMSSLMGGGGSSGFEYLMTPPLQVQAGEKLVFSAKKAKASGMGAMMGGSSDSTFVVEQAVYGVHQWLRVADFTTELDSIYKTFSISVAEPGEYRFRFRAAGEVNIDSVAGFHIDNEAPDILVVRDTTKAVSYLDLGLCKADTTTVFNVINTATGMLKTNAESTNESIFTVSANEVTVAAGDSVAVNATFKFSGGKIGRNDAFINFEPTDERVSPRSINMVAIISDPEAWAEDFNGNRMPEGWFTEGWGFRENVATIDKPSDGMGGMFGGGGGSFYLMTPVLTVNDSFEALLFSVKNAGGEGMGAMMGGSGPSLTVEKSVYGSNKWELVNTISEELDSVYKTLWVSNFEPGDYRFRFVASDSIVINSVAGFRLNSKAPDLYITQDDKVVQSLIYGMPQASLTKSFKVKNTASDVLQMNVSSSNTSAFSVSPSSLSVAAGDSVQVDVIYNDDAVNAGTHNAVITFTPTNERLLPQAVVVEAYKTYANAWSEDFEPIYVMEDESIPLDLPEWKSTGWTISKPSDGGGMMAMFGMGGGEKKTWMATTTSDTYELVTPSLQAQKGDVMQFLAEMGGGGMMDMMSMFGMGGGGSGLLNVFYSRDEGKTWTYYNTYTQTGIIYFKAPFTGIYNLKFVGLSVSLDNFLGFRRPLIDVEISDDVDNQPTLDEYCDKNVNVKYDRVLSAKDNGDGTWIPQAYTVCLPYTFDLNDYEAPGKVKLYRISYVDNYYHQLIFTEVENVLQAGVPYLAVVLHDKLALNAYDVQMIKEPLLYYTGTPQVDDYEKLILNNDTIHVGRWWGTFTANPTDYGYSDNMFCMTDDGKWIRLSLAEAALPPFRGYFYSNTIETDEFNTNSNRMNRAAGDDIIFQTKFYQQGDDEVGDMPNLLFVGDIQASESGTTAIAPTFHTIDADGTHRYYDLKGQQLKGKPQKGIYIENGIKHVR
jgi:uncharacterized protein YegP (UPF0339 family)